MKAVKMMRWFFLVMLFCFRATAQSGANLSVLVPFTNIYAGGSFAPLTLMPDGSMYGTTMSGGTNSWGTLFKLDTNGLITTLYSFDKTNGGGPQGKIVVGTNGSVYGSSPGGLQNSGQIWSVTSNGILTVLFNFNGTNGQDVFGGLAEGNDGALYGVTAGGGTNAGLYNGGAGTIFKITLDGTFTSLFSFSNTNGNQPVGGLTLGRDGNFYGTTYGGGATYTTNSPGLGTVYRMTPDGVVTTLASFSGFDGSNSQSSLVEGLDGVFYGTTDGGGTNGGRGTIFKITTNGILTSLFSFGGTNGEQPMAGMILASDGCLYGTTDEGGTNGSTFPVGDGTVFRITPDGAFTSLFGFGDTNGYMPEENLVQGRDGLLYGTTSGGSFAFRDGGIFGLSVPNASAPKLVQTVTSNTMSLTWIPLLGRTYQVEYKTELTLTNWVNLGDTIAATNSPMTVADAIGAGSKIYRVVLLP